MTLTFRQRLQLSLRMFRLAVRLARGRSTWMMRETGEIVIPLSNFWKTSRKRRESLVLKHRLRLVLRLLRMAVTITARWDDATLITSEAVVIRIPEFAEKVAKPPRQPQGSIPDPAIAISHTLSPHRSIRCHAIPADSPVCLFVTYSPDGRMWPHVLNYLRHVKRLGLYVYLIAATDREDLGFCDPGPSLVDALLVKKNEGFDFACWALALSNHPELWRARALILANDSVYGPFASFPGIVKSMLDADADFVGLTESFEINQHYQSYFIVMKGDALASAEMRRFWADIRCLEDKTQVIKAYEIGLTQCAMTAGLKTKALFPCPGHIPRGRSNLLVHDWRGLIERGMPFVKVSVLRDAGPRRRHDGWRTLLREHGYDDGLVAFHLGAVKPDSPVLHAS